MPTDPFRPDRVDAIMAASMSIPLMLATLTDRRDFGEDWLLERKLDGERCVARKDGGDVRLESRTGKDLTGTYPEVRTAVAPSRARRMLLDGEMVAYDGEQTSFSRLQQRLGVAKPSPAAGGRVPGRLLRVRPARARRRGSDRPASLQRRARLTEAIRSSGRCSSSRRGAATPSDGSPRLAGPAGRGSSPSVRMRRIARVARRIG